MKRQIIGAITLTLSMTLMDVNAYADGNANPLEYEACSNTPEKRAKIPAIKGKSYNKTRVTTQSIDIVFRALQRCAINHT